MTNLESAEVPASVYLKLMVKKIVEEQRTLGV